jgi:hypothetical protein
MFRRNKQEQLEAVRLERRKLGYEVVCGVGCRVLTP